LTKPSRAEPLRAVARPPAANEHLRPSREQAEAAVRTLLSWAGEDPAREALRDTPRRVVEAYTEYFEGYAHDPIELLRGSTFENTAAYDDLVMLRDIRFVSHCEHHITPFQGRAHVAYVPDGPVVGLSRIARVVEVLAHRLQTQENLTAAIAAAIAGALATKGVAVMLEAEHSCMSARGLRQIGVTTVTTRFLGQFETDPARASRFLALLARTPEAGR
jgi:GTP cyclohydrolase IA